MNRDPNLGCYMIEPDDDPLLRTIPEVIVPGERFVQEDTPCTYSVHDWKPEPCRCWGRWPGEEAPRADPACQECKGTGESHMEPDQIASGLSLADARLLAFGGELVAAWDGVPERLEAAGNHYGGYELDDKANAIRAALAKVKGG